MGLVEDKCTIWINNVPYGRASGKTLLEKFSFLLSEGPAGRE